LVGEGVGEVRLAEGEFVWAGEASMVYGEATAVFLSEGNCKDGLGGEKNGGEIFSLQDVVIGKEATCIARGLQINLCKGLHEFLHDIVVLRCEFVTST